MITITAHNAHEALPCAVQLLREDGVKEDSRNGPVYRAPVPVTTVLLNPRERLTFHDWRDDNPFFLHVEALWMLAGRDDLKQLTPYVKRMADYSDDGGKTSPGAYGKRWRDWDEPDRDPHSGEAVGRTKLWPDQLNWVVRRLKSNPSDRRVVIQMWDPAVDIERADDNSKDVPCNLMILPWVSGNRLHLTIFNRSNDIIWGLYSANAVQFSTLLEYLAGRLGLQAGTMTTVSNNFHAYEATMPAEDVEACPNPYGKLIQVPVIGNSLMGLWEQYPDKDAERIFQEDLCMLFEYKPEETQLKARSSYIRQVTMPLVLAHKHYKRMKGFDRYAGALEILAQMPDNDWRLSAEHWIKRRRAKWTEKNT